MSQLRQRTQCQNTYCAVLGKQKYQSCELEICDRYLEHASFRLQVYPKHSNWECQAELKAIQSPESVEDKTAYLKVGVVGRSFQATA